MKNKLSSQSFILTIGSIIISPFVARSPASFIVIILTVAGFISGIVSLRQIKTTKQGGKGLAIVSIAISGAMLVFMVLAAVVIAYFVIHPPVLSH